MRGAAKKLGGFFPEVTFSAVHRTAPLYKEDQPTFLNAVARIETDDSPEVLFEKLQTIEQELKKDPPYRFGPRTMDLDLLLYGNENIKGSGLEIPHPRMHERRFVLEPLCELIDSNTLHPVLKQSWAALLEKTHDQSCDRMEMSL